MTTLEARIIKLFRIERNVVNISQATAQIVQDTAFRNVSTSQVRSIVFRLEREGLLHHHRDSSGITRFFWAVAEGDVKAHADAIVIQKKRKMVRMSSIKLKWFVVRVKLENMPYDTWDWDWLVYKPTDFTLVALDKQDVIDIMVDTFNVPRRSIIIVEIEKAP